ncbi:hydroxymethylcytosylglucuronate/cytosylglucuronate synthase [Kitasatospora sp. NPDC059722]|uniref:hydroxymethylcytosylglucuronate/cytosylglucurona te synthase n=1 Tax=Kitasatospora sp. NPDC059722 TaxID=3346925 RepID=UPI003686071D
MSAADRRPRLLVVGVDFGWGSAGKLSSILGALAAVMPADVVGIGTRLGRPVLGDGLIGSWAECDIDDAADVRRVVAEVAPDAALVVLHPQAASALEAAGCPVVYVDSLPFLWTPHDAVPVGASLYCAQRTLPLPGPAAEVMASVANLRWVEPIVGSAARRDGRLHGRGEGRRGAAVINVGGLHSPFSRPGDTSYLDLVLPAALAALDAEGLTDVVVTGNVRALPASLPDGLPRPAVGPLPHDGFRALLGSAQTVLTSPGLTTILELASLDRTAVLLPPQNLSQVLNSELVATRCDPAFVAGWPEWVLARDSVGRWHEHGEEHAVERIHARIAEVAASPSERARAHEEITEGLIKAIAANSAPDKDFSALTPVRDGADQVAEAIVAIAGRSPR